MRAPRVPGRSWVSPAAGLLSRGWWRLRAPQCSASSPGVLGGSTCGARLNRCRGAPPRLRTPLHWAHPSEGGHTVTTTFRGSSYCGMSSLIYTLTYKQTFIIKSYNKMGCPLAGLLLWKWKTLSHLVLYILHPKLRVWWLLPELPVEFLSPTSQQRHRLSGMRFLLLFIRLLLSLPLPPEGGGGVIHAKRINPWCFQFVTWKDKLHDIIQGLY